MIASRRVADTGSPRSRGPLGPDRAQLEEQRDFLLRSLDDLEREHEAGDIDETDYESLRDDYTARAAEVLRTIDARGELRARTASPKRRVALWTVGVVVFAVLAGLLVAATSGRRDPGSVASGDPARGASENIARADQLMSEDKLEEAIAVYTEALESQPSNVRALTYRGWLYFQTDDLPKAWADLDAAVKIDVKFPDAHVFRSIMFSRDGKWTDAYSEYKLIDIASAPRDIGALLAGSRLHERILAALVGPKLLVTDPPLQAADGSSGGFTSDEIRLAADQMAEDGRILDALKLLDRLLAGKPNDATVIATRGWITGRLGQQLLDAGKVPEGQQQLATSRSALDMAVRLDPAYLPARVYRAFVALAQSLPKDADADLKIYENAKDQPVQMQMLVAESGLRAAIDAALQR